MAATMQLELDANVTDEIRQLASVLHKTPEEALEEAVSNGIHMLRRYAFYAQNRGTVSAERGLEILRSAGKDTPPDPGDEIPEDLKDWVEAQRVG
jgi:predicted transcriptional regulator